MKYLPTYEEVARELEYDPGWGLFQWRIRKAGRDFGPFFAGSADANGYRVIRLNGKLYFAHRLAWLLSTGAWPANQIDHKDGNRSNNRISNLRECTNQENMLNSKLYITSASGIKGVHWHSKARKWEAQTYINGKKSYLGLFESIDDAKDCVMKAREKNHGEFANNG